MFDNWPSSLPLPMMSSQSNISPRGGSTEMESGRVRKRRFFVDPFVVMDVQWTFRNDQFAVFKSFFDQTLKNGEKSFIISIHGGDKVVAFMEGKYGCSHTDRVVMVNSSLQIVTNLDVFLTLSGSEEDPILLASSDDMLLQSGTTYGG